MAESDDFSGLLKNLEKALKISSIKEINAAIVAHLNKRTDKGPEINIVLELVAQTYSISKRKLIKSTTRGTVPIAQKLAYCLLHFDVNLTTRFIAEHIFDKWQNSVSKGIAYYKTLNPQISADKNFLDNYLRIQTKISQKNAN